MGDVHTSAHIKLERFEAVNLVIQGCLSDESYRTGIAYIVIQLRKRTCTEEFVRGEVVSPSRAVVLETVGGRIVDASVLISPVGIHGRVHEGC